MDHVVELPGVGVDTWLGLHDGVIRDRFPGLVVERSAAEHLVVLSGVTIRRRGIGKSAREARSLDGSLEDAVDGVRSREPHDLENRGHEVHCVNVLSTKSWFRHLSRPMDDQRVGDTALVHLSLPAAKRRVACDRPAPRIVVVPQRTANFVDVGERLLHRRRHPVPCSDVVHRSGRSTFGARPIVREHEKQGVLEIAGPAQKVDEPRNLMIRVAQEPREGLHVAGIQPALVSRQGVPRGDPVGPGRELGSRREDPRSDLSAQGRIAPGRPNRRRTRPGSPRSIHVVTGEVSGTCPWRSTRRRVCRGRRRGGLEHNRLLDPPGLRSGGIPLQGCTGGRRSDCRGSGSVRTDGFRLT